MFDKADNIILLTGTSGHCGFLCTNDFCVPEGNTCDGFDDCGDNSDEDSSLCTTYTETDSGMRSTFMHYI